MNKPKRYVDLKHGWTLREGPYGHWSVYDPTGRASATAQWAQQFETVEGDDGPIPVPPSVAEHPRLELFRELNPTPDEHGDDPGPPGADTYHGIHLWECDSWDEINDWPEEEV